MKNYEYRSVFSSEIQRFLQLRAAQGLEDRNAYIMQYFDGFLVDNGVNRQELTAEIVDSWLSENANRIKNTTLVHYVSYISAFAKYLNRLGFNAFVPEQPLCQDSYVPYVFSQAEIKNIIAAADNMQFGNELSRFQFPMLLRLLYGCGMRLGEALGCRLYDVDFNEGTITVLNAKNNRDRLVPMDETLTAVLRDYCRQLDLNKICNPLLFANENGFLRQQCWARSLFNKLLASLDYEKSKTPNHDRGICLHCLRHTFAVTSLRQQEQLGIDSYDVTPLLSVYLGHAKLTETQRYLHMSAEISLDIITNMNQNMRSVFPEVPV